MGLAPALIAGSFSGSTDCERDRLTINKVGAFRTPKHRFTVYAYRYRLKSVCAECAIHGGQRIIILMDDRYFGQYGVIQLGSSVSMNGGDLVLSRPAGSDSVRESPLIVHLANGVPPKKILFDGEEVDFFK